jgi:hypothetical protein
MIGWHRNIRGAAGLLRHGSRSPCLERAVCQFLYANPYTFINTKPLQDQFLIETDTVFNTAILLSEGLGNQANLARAPSKTLLSSS